MATYGSTTGGITEATTTQQTSGGDSPYTLVNLELQRLLRGEDVSYTDPNIRAIHSITERKVENLKTEKNQFIFENGKVLAKGFPYHIHYTKNLSEFFMTEAKHSSNSKLIFPMDIDISNFTYYNVLNKQSPMKLNNKATIPTEGDYTKRSYKRYFAKQANDKSQPPFEVSKEDYQTSPLYNYVELRWYIRGERNKVYGQNVNAINIASISISDIRRILNPFQWYRFEENLSDADKLRRSLANMMDLSNYNTVNQFGGDSNPSAGDDSGLLGDDGNYSGNDQIYDEDGNLKKLC